MYHLPILYALSWACRSCEGFQLGSNITTVLAPVMLSPMPPTLVDSRNRKIRSSVLNSRTRLCLNIQHLERRITDFVFITILSLVPSGADQCYNYMWIQDLFLIPEASLIVPDFIIFVYGNSCNSFVFGLISCSFLSLFLSLHFILPWGCN